jgi:Na+-translocating ferredoxin:NAD+ oxidoreductase RnfG subunit
MIKILPFIIAFLMIFGGLYATLLGFKVINHKKDNPEFQKKMDDWHQKFDKHIKIIGIVIMIFGISYLLFPSLNPYKIDNKNAKEWTIEQKEQLIKQVINSSNLLKSINQDTARLIAKCFVDKYTTKFTHEESSKQDKMPPEEVMPLVTPLIQDCLHQYGIKTTN